MDDEKPEEVENEAAVHAAFTDRVPLTGTDWIEESKAKALKKIGARFSCVASSLGRPPKSTSDVTQDSSS